MDYELGLRLDEVRETLGNIALNQGVILKILEKADPKNYKEVIEEIRKQAKKE